LADASRDARPASLGRALIHQHARGWREQQRLQARVIKLVWQWPPQASSLGTLQVLADRSLAQPQALTDRLLR